MEYVTIGLQVFVALGIYNVWFLRGGRATAHRGGDAKSLREEFAVYGLPYWAMIVIGTLKVAAATGLLVGIFVPAVTPWAAGGLGVLMAGAVLMHIKVRDNFVKTYPSVGMLLFCVAIVVLAIRSNAA